MKTIRAEPITVLTTSNVAETVALWSAGTTYAVGGLSRSDVTHRIYESLIAGNVGKDPTDPANQPPIVGAAWLDIGPTNRWAMFDRFNETQTANANAITAKWTAAGRVTGIAFLNLDAASIRLKMTDATAGVIYDQTISLVDNSNIGNLHDWLFEPPVRRTDIALTDLPIHFGPQIEVEINAPGETAKCGNLVQGMVRQFGDTTYGASLSMITSSKREADEHGNINIIPRSHRKSGTFEVVVQKRLVDETARFLTEFTDMPCVYIGTGEYASALMFGIWRDWSIAVEHPLTSILSIHVEGFN